MKLPKLLKQPNIPENLPKDAKWLAGEGAGSWFVFLKMNERVLVRRFSPKGQFECENTYEIDFNLEDNFKMDYPSHCSVISIIHNDTKRRFEAIL